MIICGYVVCLYAVDAAELEQQYLLECAGQASLGGHEVPLR